MFGQSLLMHGGISFCSVLRWLLVATGDEQLPIRRNGKNVFANRREFYTIIHVARLEIR